MDDDDDGSRLWWKTLVKWKWLRWQQKSLLYRKTLVTLFFGNSTRIADVSFLILQTSSVLQIISGGEHQMALQEVELSTSGHFVCQITMDSPPFEFVEAGGVLTVISLPERFPVISGNKGHHYGPGDRVTLNCTCYDTFPAANIRWFINGREVIYIFRAKGFSNLSNIIKWDAFLHSVTVFEKHSKSLASQVCFQI